MFVVAFVAASALGGPDIKRVDKRVAIAMKAAHAHVLPRAVTAAQRKDLTALVGLLRAGEKRLGQKAWERFAKNYLTRVRAGDIDSIMRWVLREPYFETNKSLQGHVDKVRYYDELKSALRTCVTSARTQLRLNRSAKTVRICKLQVRPYERRARAIAKKHAATMPTEASERYLAHLTKQLASAAEDLSMVQLLLQNALQKQQMTLQAISNISKTLHHTTMAVIRNLG